MLHGASIFTYMTGSFNYGVNVGKYSSTMEHMGNLDDSGIAPQIRIRNYLTAQGWTVQKYVARNSGNYTEIAFIVRFTIPSGKHTKSYGKSHFLMGKLTISMAMFNSDVKLPEGNLRQQPVADFVGVRGKEKPFRARKHRLRANVRICAQHFRKPPCGHINSKTEGHLAVSKPCTPVVHIKIAGIYGCSSP